MILKKSVVQLLLMLLPIMLLAQPESNKNSDEQIIKQLFEKTYLHVLCEDGDPALLKETFHSGFHMYTYYDNQIYVRTRDEWISRLKDNRGVGSDNLTWKIREVDITEKAASVKLEIYDDGNIKYTDYFTLYKLEDGWKVLTKTFNFH